MGEVSKDGGITEEGVKVIQESLPGYYEKHLNKDLMVYEVILIYVQKVLNKNVHML